MLMIDDTNTIESLRAYDGRYLKGYHRTVNMLMIDDTNTIESLRTYDGGYVEDVLI